MTSPGGSALHGPEVLALQDPWRTLTVPALVRLAASDRPSAPAIVEAADTARWYHRAPLTLDNAAFQAAIERHAVQLRALGLAAGDRVLVQLPNVADLAVALLGAMTAGLVPCPVPLSLGEAELANVARTAGIRAIVTASRCGTIPAARRAIGVAAALFSVRFVCGFGEDLPDGVAALDAWDDTGVAPEAFSPQDRPAAIALITFERREGGFMAVARTHAQLLSDALAVVASARLGPDGTLLTTLPPVSALGVAASLVAPLLAGSRILLHGPFNSGLLIGDLRAAPGARLLIPASIADHLPDMLLPGRENDVLPLLAHRWTPAHQPGPAPSALVDLHAFGETALLVSTRAAGEREIRLGRENTHPLRSALPAGTILFRCRQSDRSRLQIAGPGVVLPQETQDLHEAWHETGVSCSSGQNDTLLLAPTAARHAVTRNAAA